MTLRWVCPNCPAEAASNKLRPGFFHPCPGLRGLQAPLIPEGMRAKVEAVEREDYVGREHVQTDDNGRPVMAVKTTRDDGQDMAVFAPAATGRGS